MSGAQERVQLLIPFLRCCGFLCKGTKPFSPREVFGSGEDAIVHMRFSVYGIGVTNAAGAQILVQPSPAKAPADKGPAASLGKLGVVDVAQRRELRGQSGNVCRTFILPAPFAYFARQIARQFRLRGGIFTDIMQRQLMQSFRI